jgi:hypothetical protein
MKRSWVLVAATVCLLTFTMFVLKNVSGAQQAPTPVGHLGGPVSLTPQEQQVTPAPTPSEEATPDGDAFGPEGCTVAPLPLETAVGLLNETVERQVDRESAATPFVEPTADTISSTFDVFVACVNGGDYLRIAAITTTEYFQEIITGTGWGPGEIEAKLSSLHPRDPAEYLQVLTNAPVLMVTDNLATEVVQMLDPASPYLGQFEVGVTYELVAGRWLVAGMEPVE